MCDIYVYYHYQQVNSMLVEFRSRNFRSLRDEQRLSLVASKDKGLQDTNTILSEIDAVPRLIRSAAVYGHNAGGKSNLIKAIQYMRAVVADSAAVMTPGQDFGVQPFRLDAHSHEQPTAFEATFIIEGVRYQYSFALTSQRIISEALLVYKAFKPQQWFVRYYDPQSDADHYDFSPSFKGQKNLWEKATRPNSLFLSMAVQLNNEQLRPVFDYFVNQLVIFNDSAQLNPFISINMLQDPQDKTSICSFMTTSDISITDISVVKQKIMSKAVRIDHSAGKTEVHDTEQEINQLQFHHTTEKGTVIFGLDDESQGTKRLFFLAGPIRKALQQGLTVVIDELDNSLHPLLVRRLVELFHSPSFNPKGAQLIFTTHDTSLLDPALFRRDQIWFIEKDKEQASKLYPLSDFSPRKNEAFEKGYLIGRYGAIPFFDEWGEVEE
ncbi:MAG: ATP-binding protein [Legionellales bacterium]|nr:ATP-binding protein [Legionellales bacterium]